MSVQATGGTGGLSGGIFGSSGLSGTGRAQEIAPAGSSKQRTGGLFGATPNDRVSLSNLSGALQAQQSNSPERAQRVSELSAAVGSGSYQVDPQALSGAIIQQSLRA